MKHRAHKVSTAITAALATFLSGILIVPRAFASDPNPCGADMVCASNPQSVVKALQAAGYEARLTKVEDSGDPSIGSAAAGYSFAILFSECEKHEKCGSLQFAVLPPVKKPALELANTLNNGIRFLSASVSENTLLVKMNVSTTGGLNQINFADVLADWSSALGAMSNVLNK